MCNLSLPSFSLNHHLSTYCYKPTKKSVPTFFFQPLLRTERLQIDGLKLKV